jgi:UDP:flavonoid glycosyltransferase YjiC (YdhE family)
MKIGMIAQGSNGDTEILVSLALELINRNHEVELLIITINNRDYSFLNKHKGLTVYQKHVHSEFKSNLDDLEFWNKPEEDSNRIFIKLHLMIKNDLIDYSYRLSKTNDVVIGQPHVFELACVAEKFNTPYIAVNNNPQIYRTNSAPPFKYSEIKDLTIDRLWDIFESSYNVSLKRTINKLRKEHGLMPIKNVLREILISNFLNLIPYSKYLCKSNPDWGDAYQICGFMKSENENHEWTPPANLLAFLESEEKHVLITVGSMEEHENDLQNFQNILLNTARLIRRKVIILSNWENGNMIEENVYKLKGFVSFPELLNKCGLVVHHGGMGIIHHATEAGCPSLVIKYGHDQPYNAKLLFDLGISNGSMHRKDLNAEELAGLINAALENKQMKQKAAELALLLKQENGVKCAVDLIECKMQENKISSKINI